MCGRVVQKTPIGELQSLFEAVNAVPNAAPTYNGAPTGAPPIVRLDRDGRRSLDLFRWGLIPYWAKDKSIGPRCINAMTETVATKPAFRDAFRLRRCLVPADFFYEGMKTPAGGKALHTYTIITGPPNELCAPIHNRMPVIVPREAWRRWLGEEGVRADDLLGMLRPYPAGLMRAYRVSSRVGNVRNNDPDLLVPLVA